jgi:hypothetical protein
METFPASNLKVATARLVLRLMLLLLTNSAGAGTVGVEILHSLPQQIQIMSSFALSYFNLRPSATPCGERKIIFLSDMGQFSILALEASAQHRKLGHSPIAHIYTESCGANTQAAAENMCQ